MPSFKALGNKVLSNIKKRNNNEQLDGESGRSGGSDSAVDLQGDSPEAAAARAVKAFCESGGPGQQNGDEVTFLPTIVESAESSPTAAYECAQLIRKFLKKDHWSKPSYQYNALMLARILADNPGATFTRNIDGKFVDTVKELLRNGRDLSVRQMLMETLDQFEHQKGWDEGLAGIIEMWKKEKDKAYKQYGGRLPPAPPPLMGASGPGYAPPPPNDAHSQNYFARSHSNKRLPDPAELANRLEEAKTSAGLLTQLVANTPSTEVLNNDLIKEFADRCLSASRSIQGYMTAENPGPDNETMESLIDVNEELQQALNSQKRAMLSARKEHGDRSQDPSPQPTAPEPTNGGAFRPPGAPGGAFIPGPAIPRREVGKGKGREGVPAAGPPSVGYVAPPDGPPPGPPTRRATQGLVSPLTAEEADDSERNPFLDPRPPPISEKARGKSKSPAPAPPRPGGGGSGGVPVSPVEQPSLDNEPFHPGFGQPTQSYMGRRQDSAANKEQMHGAVLPGRRGEDEDEGLTADHHPGGLRTHDVYRASAAGAARDDSPTVPRKKRYDDYDNEGGDSEDLYHNDEAGAAGGGSAAGKRPVYRY